MAVAITVSGLHEDVGPNGVHLIHGGDEYQNVLKQATELSTASLTNLDYAVYDQGKKPSGTELSNLNKAATLFDELNLFAPEKMSNYFALGRIRLILGQPQIAEEKLEQAIANSPNETNARTFRQVEYLTSQAHFFLAQCYEADGRWNDSLNEVNAAIDLPTDLKNATAKDSTLPQPDMPNYLYIRARAEIQLNELPQAQADLKRSLSLSPTNHASASLLKFVTSGTRH